MKIQRQLRIVSNSEMDPVMETGIKVAFATTDMKHVNQHFGAALSFVLYSVSMDQSMLLEAVEFEPAAMDGNEDKLTGKIEMLSDCAAVYCQAIGSSAIRMLLTHGIQPVKVSEGAEITILLKDLQEELRQEPSAWVAKAIEKTRKPDQGKFDDMAAEGWDE